MSYFFFISIHETYLIFFIKSTNIYTLFVVEIINKIGIFDYHHPLCTTFANHVVGKSFLICLSKGVLCICAKLRIVWGI